MQTVLKPETKLSEPALSPRYVPPAVENAAVQVVTTPTGAGQSVGHPNYLDFLRGRLSTAHDDCIACANRRDHIAYAEANARYEALRMCQETFRQWLSLTNRPVSL